MLTHRNILDNAVQFARVHYRPDDRLLIGAPLFHCWGLINGVLGDLRGPRDGHRRASVPDRAGARPDRAGPADASSWACRR